MNEQTLYFKDLNGLSVVCYLRVDKDDFFDNLWVYEVIVKGSLFQDFFDKRAGMPGLHYLLARNTCSHKNKLTNVEIESLIKEGVATAVSQLNRINEKMHDDVIKLNVFNKQLKYKDEDYGK